MDRCHVHALALILVGTKSNETVNVQEQSPRSDLSLTPVVYSHLDHSRGGPVVVPSDIFELILSMI